MNRNLLISLEAATRFELVNSGFADRCLTTWLCRQKNGAGNGIWTRDFDLGKVALYRWVIPAQDVSFTLFQKTLSTQN